MQDVISLVIQGVGGGLAATAPDLEGANRVRGNHPICYLN